MGIKGAKVQREEIKNTTEDDTICSLLLTATSAALHPNMDFTTFLVSLSLLATAASCSHVCGRNCAYVVQPSRQYFKHLSSELQNTSVAPWSYRQSSEEGRMPETISSAVCSSCSVQNMVPRSISLQISVFKRVRSHSGWCKCPYELAVGCTCVMKE